MGCRNQLRGRQAARQEGTLFQEVVAAGLHRAQATLEHLGTLREFAFGAMALHVTAVAAVESKRQRQNLKGYSVLGGVVMHSAPSQDGASSDGVPRVSAIQSLWQISWIT